MTKRIIGMAIWLAAASMGQAQLQVKSMSFNIRLDVAADGENRWELRKEKVAALMNYYGADFIGAQEVQHHQLEYLRQQLPGYAHIGLGRDDGKTAGEYSCIFYRQDKFLLLQQATFWLSPTPQKPGLGWDAACNRVCTYGLFQSKATGQKCWVANTHLDHVGATARLESAKLITQTLQAINTEQHPVIITGDFNARPGTAPVQHMLTAFVNARSSSQQPAYGPEDTWQAFDFFKKPDGCIDYIFVSKDILVEQFATLTDSYNLKYPSDHFPILATLQIK
jgi:endonuclease/exonuclease/phosphatase family metal-dependent hydrolase